MQHEAGLEMFFILRAPKGYRRYFKGGRKQLDPYFENVTQNVPCSEWPHKGKREVVRAEFEVAGRTSGWQDEGLCEPTPEKTSQQVRVTAKWCSAPRNCPNSIHQRKQRLFEKPAKNLCKHRKSLRPLASHRPSSARQKVHSGRVWPGRPGFPSPRPPTTGHHISPVGRATGQWRKLSSWLTAAEAGGLPPPAELPLLSWRPYSRTEAGALGLRSLFPSSISTKVSWRGSKPGAQRPQASRCPEG